jgi:hypothetical protein
VSEIHGGHALAETVAAFVLSIGGAIIVFRAWFDRGWRSREAVWPSDAERDPAGARDANVLIALFSGAAALIHLAAGPEHVEELGDIGLGFYSAGLFQAAFAVLWLTTPRPRTLAWIGIAGNIALVVAWALSRTVGLPFLPGVEAVGVADAICVGLEIGLVALLLASPTSVAAAAPAPHRVRLGTAAIVALAGVAVLGTAIAVTDLGGGEHEARHAAVHAASP